MHNEDQTRIRNIVPPRLLLLATRRYPAWRALEATFLSLFSPSEEFHLLRCEVLWESARHIASSLREIL